jgi:hypothetical protein
MALTFGFFSDPALTTPISARLQFVQDAIAPQPLDKVVYFGSRLSGRVCKASANPGVDPVVLSVVDAASGAGSPVGDVRLALSSGGLASAVGGQALNLPAVIAGGQACAVAVHVRVLDSTGASGIHVDLTLQTGALKEYAA